MITGQQALRELIEERARSLHEADRLAPLHFEPSGFDFLSPALGSADLMRRILPPAEFAAWLQELLPSIPQRTSESWLCPVESPDSTDGKLSHLDGLNISRAWMLEGIAQALPENDPRVPSLRHCATQHRRIGLASVSGDHYAGAHWLGSFAMYLVTARGLPPHSMA